ISYPINPPEYIDEHPFYGKIDYFLYITGVLFPNEIDTLFSGLCILEEPKYIKTVISENCQYSYVGLTGNISNITFDVLGVPNYYIQENILNNNIGKIEASVS